MQNHTPNLLDKVNEMLSEFQKNSDKNWLRTQEAADYLGISTTQIHILKRNGTLPFTKLGGSIYFKRQDIDAVLERNM
jgi:excisionase family DNA binding protein